MPSVSWAGVSGAQWVVSTQLPPDLYHLLKDVPPASDGSLRGDPLSAAVWKIPGYNGGGHNTRKGTFYAFFPTNSVNEQVLRARLAHVVRKLAPGRTLTFEIICEWTVTVEFSRPVPERLREDVGRRLQQRIGAGSRWAWHHSARKIMILTTSQPQPSHFEALRKALSF